MNYKKLTCPKCSGRLITLSSVDRKLCSDCKQYFTWTLKAGQESVLIEGKKG